MLLRDVKYLDYDYVMNRILWGWCLTKIMVKFGFWNSEITGPKSTWLIVICKLVCDCFLSVVSKPPRPAASVTTPCPWKATGVQTSHRQKATSDFVTCALWPGSTLGEWRDKRRSAPKRHQQSSKLCACVCVFLSGQKGAFLGPSLLAELLRVIILGA